MIVFSSFGPFAAFLDKLEKFGEKKFRVRKLNILLLLHIHIIYLFTFISSIAGWIWRYLFSVQLCSQMVNLNRMTLNKLHLHWTIHFFPFFTLLSSFFLNVTFDGFLDSNGRVTTTMMNKKHHPFATIHWFPIEWKHHRICFSFLLNLFINDPSWMIMMIIGWLRNKLSFQAQRQSANISW